jgi:hypothetical protein
MPFSDIQISAERKFDEGEHILDVFFPAMERQYGESNEAGANVRKRLQSVGVS